MKKLLYGLTTFFTAVLLVLIQAQNGLTLSSTQVTNIAEKISVLIDSTAHGSGVIIGKDGSTYHVLTAKHVVEDDAEGGFDIIPQGGPRSKGRNVRELPGIDLAVVDFSSDNNYSVANVGDSEQLETGASVWVAGFPNKSKLVESPIVNTVSGQIRARLLNPTSEGYSLIYTSPTEEGMSGGPVLDQDGLLVGIHGKGEGVAKNYGIPINTFARVASNMGVLITKGKPSSNGSSPTSQTSTSNCQNLLAQFVYWDQKEFDCDDDKCEKEAASKKADAQRDLIAGCGPNSLPIPTP